MTPSLANLPAAVQLDTRGLKCPLPVLRAQKRLRAMQAGEILEVLADDSPSWDEIALFCEQAGHQLLARKRLGDAEMQFKIRRSNL